MASKVFFQWQNPELRKTIYPFREQKLRDFLLFYRDIDLMKSLGKQPVSPAAAQEILQERARLEKQIAGAKQAVTDVRARIKVIQQEHRTVLSQPDVRKLQWGAINQRNKIAGLESQVKTVQRRKEWYEQNAPDHPYCEKFRLEYQAALPPLEAAQKELQTMEQQLAAHLGGFEGQIKAQEALIEKSKAAQTEAAARLATLPGPDKQGRLSPAAVVRMQVLKYAAELDKMTHDQLVEAVHARFTREPQRFPRWLQYMMLHFTGMRYKSAHGSWADPRDLLESLELEARKQQLAKTPPPQQESLYKQAAADLERQKAAEKDPQRLRKINLQLSQMQNTFQRQRALLAYEGEKVLAEVSKLSDQQVLERLKAKKAILPDWAWKEITARTSLRLETTDVNWETLTPEQQQARWDSENRHWNEILNAWTNKDMTAWRAEHGRTLELIVSRAVCNEVSEHIQHLRGVKPVGGLTAKPPWYLRMQASMPNKAYFRRPAAAADFKQGASILFLGWVEREPNAWQIALPLPGIDLYPSQGQEKKVNKKSLRDAQNAEWSYRAEGSRFTRNSRPLVPKEKKQGNKPPKLVPGPVLRQWLRWTHEAIVVEVAEMSEGWFVLTFETGQIGLNRRPLGRMANNWDIFVGYTPEGQVRTARINELLDPARLMPWKGMPPAGLAGGESFGIPGAGEEAGEAFEIFGRPEADEFAGVRQRWEALTPRQKQVVAHFCAGQSVRQIATALDTSTSTIYSHLSNVIHTLGLRSSQEICPVLAAVDMLPWLVTSTRRVKLTRQDNAARQEKTPEKKKKPAGQKKNG
jgi:DNA-binding CsgD family transcriptional regulator